MRISQIGWHEVQPKDNGSGWKTVGKTLGAAVIILVEITFLGTLITILSIAMHEFLAYLAIRPTASLLDLLFGLGRMFWHVLVGSVNGATAGLATSFAAGIAAGLVYLLTLLFIAPRLPVKVKRWVVALLVALAGGLGAGLGCTGMLADYGVWAGLVGGGLSLLTSLIWLS